MGRRASGWKLRQRSPGAPFSVRFTWDGEAYEPSTGTSDPALAAIEAAKIYAAAITKPPKRRVASAGARPLDELLEDWLLAKSTTLSTGTLAVYKTYAESHWLAFFAELRDITDSGCVAYMQHRLGKALASTVRQELVGLRNFCGWLTANGHAGPITVPRITKAMLGVPSPTPKRVAAPELEPDEIAAFIAALPTWARSKDGHLFPVRARFLVQYETSLRPSTISRLRCPEHWSPGSTRLTITRDIDKVRWARPVPLSAAAIEALEVVVTGDGPIFGSHIYKHHVRRAAKAAMPEWKAKLFAGAHLRSARLTHTIELTGNLMGAQYMAGHRDLKSTSRYARPSERAALNMLAALAKRESGAV